MFLSPDDSILREFTELDVMITWKGMPEDRQRNFCMRDAYYSFHLKLHLNLCSDIRIHITYFMMNTDFMPQSADRG